MEKIHDFTDVRRLWGDVATKIDANFAELAGKTGALADLGRVASDDEAFAQAAVLAGNTGVCLISWHTDIESGYILQSAITPNVVMQLRLATDANGTSYMRKVQDGEAGKWTEWPTGGLDEPSVDADDEKVTLKNGGKALFELGGATEEQAGIVTADDYSRMLNKQVVEMGDVADEEALIEKIKILCDLNTPRIVVYERGKGDGATFYQGWLMLFNNVNGLKKHVVCFEASGNDTSYKNLCVYNFNHKDTDAWEYVNKFELGDGAVAQEALEAAGAAQTAAEGAQRTAETANSTAGAAKTAADGAVKDAASAKSTAEAAQAAASTASQTASTAKSTADTAKSTADTAKQTAEGAKASAEGLTGDVTAMGLSQSFLADYAGTGEPVAAGAAAVSVLTSTLKKDELVPWHGWFTLVACYSTDDAGAQLGVSGKHGESAEQVIVPLTKVSAGERVVAKLTADPGTRTVTLEGGDTVEVRKLTTTGALTLHWAVLYESDPDGNPRRRGGSEREMIEGMLNSYVNSGIHTGGISNARYNERTGWFEVNGLTDMTFDDCLAVLGDFAPKVRIDAMNNDFTSSARTNNALQGIYNSGVNFNFVNGGGEVICLGPQLRNNLSGFLYDNTNNGVIAILSYIRFLSNFTQSSTEIKAVNLETVDFRDLHTNLSLKNLASLSYETFRFMIEFATNSAAITVTVHADVYAKMTGGTVDDWGSLGTLAEGKGVKLVSYGESGYPFLTRVLWHSYKRLENKINAAKSGDVIYIHPDDRRKITAAQKDDWGALVTAGAEKQISFALPAEAES